MPTVKKIKLAQLGIRHEPASGKRITMRLRPDLVAIVGVADDRNLTTSADRFTEGELAHYEGLPLMTEQELFAIPGLEAVAVEVPNLDLVPAAFRCLEHGLPIHMDKPGGEDLAVFTRLRRGYEERGLPFQMGYMFRGNPAMQWIKQAVTKGYLGEIFEIQASMSHNYGGDEYQDYIGTFRGGIMFNLGCHLIDFVVALMGRPAGITPFLQPVPGDKSLNNCLTVLQYPGAIVTLLACSREVDGFEKRRLRICGTKGSVDLCPLERFDGQPLTMQLVLKEGNEEHDAGTHTLDFGAVRDRYEDQLVELAQMIRGKIANPYDSRHDCLVEEVLLAASGYTKWNK